MNFNCLNEGVSEVSERVHEQSIGKRSVVDGVSGVSEQTNAASNRAARLKTRLSETRNPPSLFLFLSALLDSQKQFRFDGPLGTCICSHRSLHSLT